MANRPLIDRYIKFEQWIDQLPPAQYSIVMGTIFATVWTVMEIILGGQSIWAAILLGLLGGAASSGFIYWTRQ